MTTCKKLFLIAFLLVQPLLSGAQMRCFEFSLPIPGDWRDTACVACTSDPQVLTEVQAELALPRASRVRHINGYIGGGNAGVNRNGAHPFLWHFKPNEWRLAELSIEVCDGRPHADVDADTAYWLNTVRQFCPWTSFVNREIGTTGIGDPAKDGWQVACYPNPVISHATFVSNRAYRGAVRIVDLAGKTVHTEVIAIAANGQVTLSLDRLAPGSYFVQFEGPVRPYVLRLTKV